MDATTREVTEKVFDIFEKANESPRKYLRLYLGKHKRVIFFNGETHLIDKCTVCYRDSNGNSITHTVDQAFIEKNAFSLLTVLRPNKHFAVAIVRNNMQIVKYFRLDEKEHIAQNDHFICVVESQRETFLIAYLRGMYFLRTFDADFPITLYALIQFLTQPQEPETKEADTHGKEA